jgi:hypothetical protein
MDATGANAGDNPPKAVSEACGATVVQIEVNTEVPAPTVKSRRKRMEQEMESKAEAGPEAEERQIRKRSRRARGLEPVEEVAEAEATEVLPEVKKTRPKTRSKTISRKEPSTEIQTAPPPMKVSAKRRRAVPKGILATRRGGEGNEAALTVEAKGTTAAARRKQTAQPGALPVSGFCNFRDSGPNPEIAKAAEETKQEEGRVLRRVRIKRVRTS